ncbi:MFS transporter [uncultured Actinomyces sp.]|uniref:MFS transporter n=1 Tax=uncultured Actinomyces sp. TaxID=249061 RepID=UPI0028EFBBDA|nr:MFS transporter [uncultured Actinomyces sp.]
MTLSAVPDSSNLRMCYATTAKIRSTVSNCADLVTATAGDEEVRTSCDLAGIDLSSRASTAADAVVAARKSFASRLTDHSDGIYDATRAIRAADDDAAAGVPAGSH